MAILAVNAGSSSLKFSLHPLEGGQVLPHSLSGNVQGLEPGGTPEMGWSFQGQKHTETLAVPAGAAPFTVALERLRRLVQELAAAQGIQAVAHRVVHGGGEYTASVRVTDEVLERLARFNSLAPLHQPHNLEGIRRFRAAFPEVAQVACFDTAFHAHMPEVDYAFALPQELRAQGVRRYGFHGLSYQYIMSVLQEQTLRGRGRVVMAHLGNGASLCAAREGVSVATTMGFSALDGLMMGTRSGSLDAGVLLYLMEQGWDHARIEKLLYKQSGLLGISGLTGDMRDLLLERRENQDRRASLAIEMFCQRVRRYIGAYLAEMGGADALVFTGGIGQNAAEVRAEICQGLEWFGVELDPEANAGLGGEQSGAITRGDCRLPVYVIPTNEELLIARDTVRSILQG